MLNILKNNFCRMRAQLPGLLVMTLIALASIALAVYMTGVQQVKAHIVLVEPGTAATLHSKYVSLTVKRREPPRSALVRQQYDAYVIPGGDGSYKIVTLRNAQFKSMLLALLKNPRAAVPGLKTGRSVGENIFGYMLMFLLFGISMSLFPFSQDKEQGQLARIAASPVSFAGYLAAHCISCFSMFIPPFVMLTVMKALGFNVGFSLPQYALLMALLGAFGISFALLLHTLIKKADNATMLCNTLLVLSSILSGSFYSFAGKNRLLNALTDVLAQKQLLSYAQHIAGGGSLTHAGSLAYVAAVSAALFAVSAVKLKKTYVKRI